MHQQDHDDSRSVDREVSILDTSNVPDSSVVIHILALSSNLGL